MNWLEVSLAILANSAFTAIIIAASAFVARSIIQRWFSKNLEKYKTELQKELEKFKMELKQAAFKQETLFTKLHEKRTRIIAELHKKLVRVEHSLIFSSQGVHLRADLEIPYDTAVSESKKMFESALERVIEFQKYFDENRIFLSRSLCAKIEDLTEKFSTTLNDLEQTFKPTPPGTEGPGPAIRAVWRAAKRVQVIIPPVRQDIEQEFRSILGVDETSLEEPSKMS